VPLTLGFKYLRAEFGIIYGALIVGVLTIIIAFTALQLIDETYGRDLNFEEID
jgi:MFS transporter, putative metabolite:H+ symporter